MSARLTFSPVAENDLDEIFEYIARDNFDAAIECVGSIRSRCQLLVEFPDMGQRRPDLGSGLRSISIGSYVIFYSHTGDEVQIARILHGARDTGPLFQ